MAVGLVRQKQQKGGFVVIRLQHITKQYGTHIVFSDFSYEIAEDAKLCVMGRSGRGKTTLFRMLLGLEQPDGGYIEGLKGKRMCAVFQENRLLPDFSVRENLRCVCRNRQQTAQIPKILEKLGLTDWEHQPVCVLSGGMQRRIAIGRALLVESDILLLDEPFSGLDENTKRQMIQVILGYTKEQILIVATHAAEDADLLGAKVLHLDDVSY